MFKHSKLFIHLGLFIALCTVVSVTLNSEALVQMVSAQSSNGKLTIQSVRASTDDGNVAENTLDGDLNTRWSGYDEADITFDLGSPQTVHRIDIAFYRGNLREQEFEIEVSTDNDDWDEAYEGESNGRTTGFQSFELETEEPVRYVRFVGDGNSENDWNSLTEVAIYGEGGSTNPNPSTPGQTNRPQPTQPQSTGGPAASLPPGTVIDESNDSTGATPVAQTPRPSTSNSPRPSTSSTPNRTSTPRPSATTTQVPSPTTSGPTNPPAQGGIPTEPNLKIAFTGDTGIDEEYQDVLNLVKAEGAHALVVPGDLAYSTVPAEMQQWETMINNTLGANYPYFISIGNHETTAMWTNNYVPRFTQRMASNGVEVSGNVSTSNFGVVYKGLKMVFAESESPAIIGQQLANDNHIWKVCGWHELMERMQVGEKGDQAVWELYEGCRQYGAIIATAHEHSYQRTKTLSSMRNQTVDPAWPDPKNLRVTRGSTFAFVSGAGGKSVRSQLRCLTATEAGCGIWAAVRTSTQRATYGAFFITFNVDGDPRKATAYYKEIDGRVTDGDITITAN